MALELVYTSAARGLRAGTSGFCTVAMTKGFPPALVPRLEALGGYRAGPSGDGPLSYCFWRVETATGIANVLSIVGPAPPDHTARTNKIATYLVLAPEELVSAGPAALLARAGLLRREWSGAPAWIEQAVRVPAPGDASPRPCAAWQAAAGDAGWAGVLASNFLRDQSKPIHVIYGAGVDPLPLVDEAIRLLPDWARWRATFSTYFLQPVAGTPCAWRFCLEGTPAADAARQSKGLLIDLTRTLGVVPDSRFTRMARSGIDEEAVAATAAKARAPSRTSAAAKAADDAPIGLAPETDDGRPRSTRLPVVITDDQETAPEVPAAQPVKPVMIALVAAVLTLLLLLVIVLVSSGAKGKAGTETTEPAAPAAPASEGAPAGTGAAAAPMKAPPLTLSPDGVPEKPAEPPSTPPSPPSSPPPSTPAEEQAPVAPAPSAAPADPAPPVAPPAAAPVVPAAPVAPLAPVAPPAPTAPPAPVAPVAVLPVAQWTMSFSGGNGTESLSARCDVPIAKARSARIVLPKELVDAGAKVGERNAVTFGAATLRAVPQVDDGIVKVAVTASGTVPESLAALVGGKQADGKPIAATIAVQRALERCTVEVLDAGGNPLGSAQMRARMTKPIGFAAKPGGAKPTIVPDVAEVPLSVQLLSGSTGERMVAIATDRSIPGRSMEIPVDEWLRVAVDRGRQKSGIVVTASLPADIATRKGAITMKVTDLRALNAACIAVRDVAKGSRRGTGFEADLQAVQNALTDEELARVAPGSARNVPLADAPAMMAAVDAVEPRTAAALDAASRSLAELSQVSADRSRLPARIVVRISNDDGIVLLESEVKVVPGGGS
jgi:hypothetical protein